MTWYDLFWTNFLATFPFVLGAVLGLLPALLLVLSTIALGLRAHHQREMYRLEGSRMLLGVEPDAEREQRMRARVHLQTGA